MNSEPLIKLNPTNISHFKDLRKEINEQLKTLRKYLGKYYNLLDNAIIEHSFTEFSRITRSIRNRENIINALEEEIGELLKKKP